MAPDLRGRLEKLRACLARLEEMRGRVNDAREFAADADVSDIVERNFHLAIEASSTSPRMPPPTADSPVRKRARAYSMPWLGRSASRNPTRNRAVGGSRFGTSWYITMPTSTERSSSAS